MIDKKIEIITSEIADKLPLFCELQIFSRFYGQSSRYRKFSHCEPEMVTFTIG